MLRKEEIVAFLERDVFADVGNVVEAEVALNPDLAGLRMLEPPIVGCAAADDEGFLALLAPEAVGEHFKMPNHWLGGARSVVSVFFPFTERVRKENAAVREEPSESWLHARIEGQAYIEAVTARLVAFLEAKGYRAVAPCIDPRFRSCAARNAALAGPDELPADVRFTSNWSERHVAFVCGLGTFGLSKGLITERGMAGRLTSVITDAPITPDEKSSLGLYENCTRCGACARNCPARAISLESGKDHDLCAIFLERTRERYRPRYGCGKCQVGVPCECLNPAGAS